MLNAIAREIDQPDLAKSTTAERPDLIHRALRDSDVLLVLDNLETLPEPDRDLLFAFLNRLPRGCSAITTSRRRADASAIAVRLDKLDWPTASDLMAEVAKNNDRLRKASDAERRSLYEETGGNPLLIRWVAGQLGLGRCRTLASALDFLRNAPAGNNPLEFIFGDLLDTFTSSETKVLAALTHFTTAMEVKFIAGLGGVSETAAQTALSDLSNRALVVPDAEERRFVLVPMVADFLRRKKPEVVKQTADRLEARAYALIVENGYGRHDRFPVLDAAWPTVAPALPLFLAGPNDELQTVCGALARFLDFTGRWDEAISLHQKAETVADQTGDAISAGGRAYEAGWLHYLRHEADAVEACAGRALAHHERGRAGAAECAFAIRLRGLAHKLRGDYGAAVEVYRKAIELKKKDPRRRYLAAFHKDLAEIQRLSGDAEASRRNFRKALRIVRAERDDEGVAYVTGNLADLALDEGDWPEARSTARKALALSVKTGRQELIGRNCGRLAKALARQGKKKEGLPYARRAVDIYTKLGLPDLEAARKTLAECGG